MVYVLKNTVNFPSSSLPFISLLISLPFYLLHFHPLPLSPILLLVYLPFSCPLHLSDDLIASAGATHGLNMLTQLLFSPGDLIFVEDPTFFIATKMFQEDCKMITVPGKLLHKKTSSTQKSRQWPKYSSSSSDGLVQTACVSLSRQFLHKQQHFTVTSLPFYYF